MTCTFDEVQTVSVTTTPAKELARYGWTREQVREALLADKWRVTEFRLPKSGEHAVCYSVTSKPYVTTVYGHMSCYRPLLIVRPQEQPDPTGLDAIWE